MIFVRIKKSVGGEERGGEEKMRRIGVKASDDVAYGTENKQESGNSLSVQERHPALFFPVRLW